MRVLGKELAMSWLEAFFIPIGPGMRFGDGLRLLAKNHFSVDAPRSRSVIMPGEAPMAKIILRTGKRTRPKTAVRGKRLRCSRCRRRSPKPVKTPAPWYCPSCLSKEETPSSKLHIIPVE
jgi:hypothetical protein